MVRFRPTWAGIHQFWASFPKLTRFQQMPARIRPDLEEFIFCFGATFDGISMQHRKRLKSCSRSRVLSQEWLGSGQRVSRSRWCANTFRAHLPAPLEPHEFAGNGDISEIRRPRRRPRGTRDHSARMQGKGSARHPQLSIPRCMQMHGPRSSDH